MKRIFSFIVFILFIAAIPLAVQAQETLCESCETPSSVTVTGVTNNSATVSWFMSSSCPVTVMLYNNFTMSYVFGISYTGSSYTFTGLDPCTPYSVMIFMSTTGPFPVDCKPAQIDFKTKCDVGCNRCDPPTNLTVTSLSSTSATVTWVPANFCSWFYVTITDVATGSMHTYVVNGSSYTFTGLLPGHDYVISVRVISNSNPPVDCVPVSTQIHTPSPCDQCVMPLAVSISGITGTSASVNWTPGSLCNDFRVSIVDDYYIYYSSVIVSGTSYTFTGLAPSTHYTVYVANISTQSPPVDCAPRTADFTTTNCGNFTNTPSPIYIQYFWLSEAGTISTPKYWNLSPSLGYVHMGSAFAMTGSSQTSGTYQLALGQTYYYAGGVCRLPYQTTPGTTYFNLWIDWDNDGVFSSSEHVLHIYTGASGSGLCTNSSGTTDCVDISPCYPGSSGTYFTCSPGPSNFTTPSSAFGPVRARLIQSVDADPGPCDGFAKGQIIDFMVQGQ